MTHIRLLAMVLPRLAAAQTVPAIPLSNTTPHQVETCIGTPSGGVMRLRWGVMSRRAAASP